jgi:hypothetical protein
MVYPPAICAAEGSEHNARGLFAIGPQFVTPSDVLSKLIDAAKLQLADQHYAPDPREQRRAMRLYSGRERERQRELGIR